MGVDFGVSQDTWLPRRACAAPDCPHFLALQPAQEDRVSDGVWRHLESAGIVPGLNRYVRQRLESPPATIADTVCAGAHLLPCGDALEAQVARILRSVALGAGDEGCDGRASLCRQIER